MTGMGSNQSKTAPGAPPLTRAPIGKAPSVAFGRLRLDSPESRRISRSLQKNRSADSLTPLTKVRLVSSSVSSDNLDAGYGAKRGGRKTTILPSKHASEASPLLGHDVFLSNGDGSSLFIESASRSSYGKTLPPAWWLVPALICATCYALYNVCIKLGSASIHPILGGVVLQFVAAILGSVMLLIIVWKEGYDDLHYDAEGIKWAILAGVAVGAAEILSFTVSGMGVPASQSIPIIIGGSVGIGCILGVVILHEVLGMQGWIGVAMIIFGVGLVGTDPRGAGLH